MIESRNQLAYWLHDLNAINFEQTHQLMLAGLLRIPAFATAFCQEESKVIDVKREIEGGTFDLGIYFENGNKVFVELKMWSGLGDKQIKKQTEYLNGGLNRKGIYLLLGVSFMEIKQSYLSEKSGDLSRKMDGEEYAALLKNFKKTDAVGVPIEVIETYAAAIERQNNWLQNAWKGEYKDKEAIYQRTMSFYWRIEQQLPEHISTNMYSMGRSGGKILQCTNNKIPFSMNGESGHIYMEIFNRVICIRFATRSGNTPVLRQIQNHLADYFTEKLKSNYPELERHRRGTKWMKIVSYPVDFDLGVERVAEIFEEWDGVMKGFGEEQAG